jgi:hypothetical protein
MGDQGGIKKGDPPPVPPLKALKGGTAQSHRMIGSHPYVVKTCKELWMVRGSLMTVDGQRSSILVKCKQSWDCKNIIPYS